MLDYIVMQMRKVNREKGYSIQLSTQLKITQKYLILTSAYKLYPTGDQNDRNV